MGKISECYATGDVTGISNKYTFIGGFAGAVNWRTTEIVDCYAVNGYVRADSSSLSKDSSVEVYVGGFIGFSAGTIKNCYAVNYVYSSSYGETNNHIHYIGGFAGYNKAVINGCFVLNAYEKLMRTGLETGSFCVVGSGTAKAFYAGGFVGITIIY